MSQTKTIINGFELKKSEIKIIKFLLSHKTGVKAWDLHAKAKIPLSTVSLGLRELKERGLFTESECYYRINPALFDDMREAINELKETKEVIEDDVERTSKDKGTPGN